jgi:hypothetical protein
LTLPDLPERGRSQNVTGREDRYNQIYIAVIQLQAKIDALTQVIALRDAAFNDQLRRIHEEQLDHENRLRQLELRRVVEPRTVWTAFGLTITGGGLLIAIINLITR